MEASASAWRWRANSALSMVAVAGLEALACGLRLATSDRSSRAAAPTARGVSGVGQFQCGSEGRRCAAREASDRAVALRRTGIRSMSDLLGGLGWTRSEGILLKYWWRSERRISVFQLTSRW